MSVGKIPRPSGMCSSPRRAIAWSGMLSMRMPSNVISPSEGDIIPLTVRSRVVLPTPFGPSNATTDPWGTINETCCRATKAP